MDIYSICCCLINLPLSYFDFIDEFVKVVKKLFSVFAITVGFCGQFTSMAFDQTDALHIIISLLKR